MHESVDPPGPSACCAPKAIEQDGRMPEKPIFSFSSLRLPSLPASAPFVALGSIFSLSALACPCPVCILGSISCWVRALLESF
ncbi:MAG: hypothetical protein V1728_02640, partial [Candidatus Micrarchaeota archaeon]